LGEYRAADEQRVLRARTLEIAAILTAMPESATWELAASQAATVCPELGLAMS
jgi:hypothetical protein